VESNSPEQIIKSDLVKLLQHYWNDLNFDQAILDQGYPVYESSEGVLLISKVMVLSQAFGAVLFAPVELNDQTPASVVEDAISHVEDIAGEIMAKLTREKRTRSFGTDEYVRCVVFAPLLRGALPINSDVPIVRNAKELLEYFKQSRRIDLSEEDFLLIQSVVEMSYRLRKSKRRTLQKAESRGQLASNAEVEISVFDRKQQDFFLREITGPERIKGLAGSGKTVILAIKAALLHAMYPEAKIVYTYYTKSLHQQIERFISQFFQEMTNREPNWDNLKVMHGWGGRKQTGFYYEVCREHTIPPMSLGQAGHSTFDPFDFICRQLIDSKVDLRPMYDYVLIDEGQDFPSSFLRIAKSVTRGGKIVWAYDALQNIFNVKAPRAEEIFDNLKQEELSDQTLYKCYRNSAEVLVTAHSLGFGIYGEIIQMLDSQEYWEDLGYKLVSGELKPGSQVRIERPADHSLKAISIASPKEDIVIAHTFPDMESEVKWIVGSIIDNHRNDELRLDDIMVVTVDRFAGRKYCDAIEAGLAENGIRSNNLYADPAGGHEFWKDHHVTLAQVNRAKGNEAYMVYVVGTDALFKPRPTAVSRNAIFTAMTRAKGWVRITGVDNQNSNWKTEIDIALRNAPAMVFTYPTKDLQVMQRELQKGKLKQKTQRQQQLVEKMNMDELKELQELTEARMHILQKLSSFASDATNADPSSESTDENTDDEAWGLDLFDGN